MAFAKLDSPDTSCRYVYNTEWSLQFKFGAALMSTFTGKLKCLPTAGTQQGISVSSIGVLFDVLYFEGMSDVFHGPVSLLSDSCSEIGGSAPQTNLYDYLASGHKANFSIAHI